MSPNEIGKFAIIHELQELGVSENNAKEFADKIIARADKYYLAQQQEKGLKIISEVLLADFPEDRKQEFIN